MNRATDSTDSNSFEAECLRETGYPSSHYPGMFRDDRTDGLPYALGGLHSSSTLAKHAIRIYHATVTDQQPIRRTVEGERGNHTP